MTDIIQTLVEACIKEVTRVRMNPEPGEPLTLSRAVKISRAVLKSGGNDLVETVVQRFQRPRLGENSNADHGRRHDLCVRRRVRRHQSPSRNSLRNFKVSLEDVHRVIREIEA